MTEKKKNLLVKGKQEKEEEERIQAGLRKEHHIQDENVVVVEKKTTFKFIVTLIINFVKLIATIAILTLATTGLIGLLYPEPRTELVMIFTEIWESVKEFLNVV